MNTTAKLFLLLLISIPLLSTNPADTLTIDGIKDRYSTQDTVVMTVTNNFREKIFVVVNLERFLDHKWRLVKEDVYSCLNCMAVGAKVFEPQQTRQVKWRIKSIEEIWDDKMPLGKYRLNLRWYGEFSKKVIYTPSREFKIEAGRSGVKP